MIYESNTGVISPDTVEITGRPDIEVGWIYRDAVFSPPLAERQRLKLLQLQMYAEEEQRKGVMTSVGLRMKYGSQDCFLVDGAIRYSELKGLPAVVKLIEADGTEHTGTVFIADGKTILIEQFEAAYALEELVKTIEQQIRAAETIEALDRIVWE
jgi:hypothetical protein